MPWLAVQVHPRAARSRPNMPQLRQPRPDSGLGFQVKVLHTFQVVPASLGTGRRFIIFGFDSDVRSRAGGLAMCDFFCACLYRFGGLRMQTLNRSRVSSEHVQVKNLVLSSGTDL